MGDLPIVDLEPLLHGGPAGAARTAAAVGAASREIGFFYVRNHGIPDAVRDGAFAAAERFFAQPEAVKKAVSYFKSPHNRGYAPIGGENLDPDLLADIKETYNAGRELAPDDPDIVGGTPYCGANLWPAMPSFREPLLAYFAAVQTLGERLHEAFAIDLGLRPDFFAPFIDRPLATLRILHYPPHPGMFDARQYGAGPHTDYGNLTVLAQDDVGGLEVRGRDGEWIAAPPIPGTFVCNIGDCLMRWSNDTYVSTPHRVVNRTGRERYSVAFFFDPNADAHVACLPTCCDAMRPARYAPIDFAPYLTERLERSYVRPA